MSHLGIIMDGKTAVQKCKSHGTENQSAQSAVLKYFKTVEIKNVRIEIVDFF